MRSQNEHDQGATCRRAPVTNKLAFEQHRYYLELQLRSAKPIPPCAPYVDPKVHYTMYYTAEWMGRYKRRRDAIEGIFDGPWPTFRPSNSLSRDTGPRTPTRDRFPTGTPS